MSALPERVVGELFLTTTGRTVEILATDSLDGTDGWGDAATLDVTAYRYMGGTVVHLRATSRTSAWTRIT